ncbi:MAG TPA: hypothetical protein VEK08_23150 [Planctomycetota bacterium]|nr:hypothetical protein [Planctomycetota bacterium]
MKQTVTLTHWVHPEIISFVFEFEDLSRAERRRNIPRTLLKSPKTLLLPHLGSAVEKVRFDIAMSAARSIAAVLSGKRPDTLIN